MAPLAQAPSSQGLCLEVISTSFMLLTFSFNVNHRVNVKKKKKKQGKVEAVQYQDLEQRVRRKSCHQDGRMADVARAFCFVGLEL